MSFTLLVPADDSQPIGMHELSEGATVSAQARQLFDGLWEVVRARGLHQLAPELWAVMPVDENGHGKGLPLNRRGGELYGEDARFLVSSGVGALAALREPVETSRPVERQP
jgi:hypothetical protein